MGSCANFWIWLHRFRQLFSFLCLTVRIVEGHAYVIATRLDTVGFTVIIIMRSLLNPSHLLCLLQNGICSFLGVMPSIGSLSSNEVMLQLDQLPSIAMKRNHHLGYLLALGH